MLCGCLSFSLVASFLLFADCMSLVCTEIPEWLATYVTSPASSQHDLQVSCNAHPFSLPIVLGVEGCVNVSQSLPGSLPCTAHLKTYGTHCRTYDLPIVWICVAAVCTPSFYFLLFTND